MKNIQLFSQLPLWQKSIFTFVFFICCLQLSAQCPPGDLTLSTQAEIDNFATDYPGCIAITGNLVISGSTINDLSGLAQLEAVNNSFDIDNCDNLIDLTGLENLSYVGFHLWIKNNAELASLDGFGLVELGWWLDIENNASLESLAGMGGMISFGEGIFEDGAAINIRDNAALKDLVGLEGVINITEHLWITGNGALESLEGLDNLESLDSYLEISNNPALVDISALAGIDASTIFNEDFPSITELEIVNNTNLSDCAIQSVCDFLDITDPDYNASIFNNTGDCIDLPTVEAVCDGIVCDHPDFNALVALFNSTNGFNWFENTGWIDGALGDDCDPCSWYGVTCNEDDRVICIDLDGQDGCNSFGIGAGNNLDGILPAEINELTELEQFHLEGNANLVGDLPIEFYDLTSLQVAYIHITGLTGQILPEIANLTQLENFTAGFGPMGGPIPEEFGSLTSLTSLNLFFADFSGEIPWQLANLSNLTELRLNDNMLEGCFPPQLETLCGVGTTVFSNNPGLPGGGDFAAFCASGTGSCLECDNTIEGPIVDGITTEDYSTAGGDWTRYNLPVINWDVYPEEMFEPAPQLPACGLNTNASRSWVSIFNAETDAYIYGFCALGDPANLQNIWFAVEQGTCPPEQVFIEIHDRACDIYYYSELITLPACCPVVDENDGEISWGIWNDGGADAARSNSAQYANSGTFSFLIKDNTSTSEIYTDDLDLTYAEVVTIDFNYITIGFNNNTHDFWLEVSTDGGNNYTTVQEYVYTEDFVNNERKFENVTIPGPFTANTRIRFKCDAAGNNDKVYIDDIVIRGCFNTIPTCDDGIQNGDETGVDCGGIDCPECEPCNVFNENDFEASLGIWNDGGADAAWSNNYVYSNSGDNTMMIKDNTSTSVMTTDDLELGFASEVVVDFTFITTGFNNSTHDFWLQLSTDGGSTFTTIKEWVYTEDFFNDVRVFDNIFIGGPFTDQTQLRFRCDAAGNNDKVYMDDVIIEACEYEENANDSNITTRAASKTLDFTAYPNPIVRGSEFNVSIESSAQTAELHMTNILGEVVLTKVVSSDNFDRVYISNTDFRSGTYFISIDDGLERKVKQVVIIH